MKNTSNISELRDKWYNRASSYDKMRIILITQNEPFYLSENLNTFIKRLPVEHNVVVQSFTGALLLVKENFKKSS